MGFMSESCGESLSVFGEDPSASLSASQTGKDLPKKMCFDSCKARDQWKTMASKT
jgi:hypothetical protein